MLDYEKLTDEQILAMSQSIDFFAYELDFATLTHATTQQNSFTIQADSSFIWMRGSYHADIAAAAYVSAAVPYPNVTCLIQDTSSGRQLMSNAVPLDSLFAAPGQTRFDLPVQRFFRAATQITVTLTNYDAAVDYNIRVTFAGMKRFTYKASI